MKSTALTLFLTAVATLGSLTANADERINQLLLDSDERFFEDNPYELNFNSFTKSISVNDIDSVTFDIRNQRLNVYSSINNNLITAWYDLSKLIGFTFSYIEDLTMPSTMISGTVSDRNTMTLNWRPVKNASGYEIAFAPVTGPSTDWINAKDTKHITVDGNVSSLEVTDLFYSTSYMVAIRVLSSLGEAYHSPWASRCSLKAAQFNYSWVYTESRGDVPQLFSDFRSDTLSIALSFSLDPASEYASNFGMRLDPKLEIVDDKFVYDKVMISEVGGETTYQTITPAQLASGEVVLNNLKESTLYRIALYNSNLKPCDAPYSIISVMTKGPAGAPILIEHRVATAAIPGSEYEDEALTQKWFEGEQKYQACRIDTIISNYCDDPTLAEGQVFMLEGGKTYYLRNATYITKGFSLCTNPDDLAAGKDRAKVYLGSIFRDDSGYRANNWWVGKAPDNAELYGMKLHIGKVIFTDIDFDCPESVNYGEYYTSNIPVTANYFLNTLSSGSDFELEALELHNCTFQGIRRGFIRIQGSKQRIINHLILDNNVFFNCGYYSNNGIDYNVIHGEALTSQENICGDLQVTNNTFYNCPMGTFSPTKNKAPSADFADNVHWNIRLENNTFINHCTRKDQALLNIREVPGDSKISIKNNLIVLTRDETDARRLGFYGIDIRNIHGSGEIAFDIRDNYSASSEAAYRVDNGIVTNKTYAFSATKNAPGAWPDCLSGNSVDDLVIKVGSEPLMATDIFNAPNPKYIATSDMDNNPLMHYTDPEEIWNNLTYKSSGSLLNHEIYTKGIGAPRWRSADPKSFRIDPAND